MNCLKNQYRAPRTAVAFALFTATTVFTGCASNPDDTTTDDAESSQVVGMVDMNQLPEDAMRGAKLWADNCIRCHNIRPPKSLSDRQWETVMMHMRVRANLTGEEQRQILKFLQAAN